MGVTTAADVCNLALVAIGHTDFITDPDLDEDSTESEVAAKVYATCVEVTLERAEWNFAARRKTLAMVAGPGVNEQLLRNGWAYVYSWPADCVAARRITLDGIRAPPPIARPVFAVESDDTGGRGNVTGKVIVTDQVEAELQYTGRVNIPALWSGPFVEALSWKLAAKFALGIQKKSATALEMEKMFERALGIAASSQQRQGTEDQPALSEYTIVRG